MLKCALAQSTPVVFLELLASRVSENPRSHLLIQFCFPGPYIFGGVSLLWAPMLFQRWGGFYECVRGWLPQCSGSSMGRRYLAMLLLEALSENDFVPWRYVKLAG